MGWYVLFALMAAFGVLCALWVLFGWLLLPVRGEWLLYPGRQGGLSFVPVYLWLRDLGLVRCPLIVADLGLDREEKMYLEEKGIEVYSPAELPERLGMGAKTQ